MSPVGNFESLTAAIQGGCNSVYFGVEQLNMRAKSTINFQFEDLEQIVFRCKKNNIKSYLTVNTIIYDHDISVLKNLLNEAKRCGVDAVIVSDQSAISYAKSIGLTVHISTQCNITNIESVKFYALFADVMVLSRELSLQQVKTITAAIERDDVRGPSGRLVKIEIFGHGALCMAVSGKCYLSLHTQNASANRGACVQNCRRKYKVIDIEDGHELEIDNEYIMSAQDLCTIDFLDKVVEAGVGVLKIEGRGKGADYVYTVTKNYREAIDKYYAGEYDAKLAKKLKNNLEQVYNRGLWSGYYLGKKMGEWNDQYGSKAKIKKIFVGNGVKYFSQKKIAEVEITTYPLKKGDKILIIGPTTGVLEHKLDELWLQGKPVDEAPKGTNISFSIDTKVRASDKVYRLVSE